MPTTRPSLRAILRPATLLAGLAAGCAASSAWAAVRATALPEPMLRLSPTLSTPSPVSELDRSLLRVEWKAARSGVDEAEELALLMQRVERMNGTVNEVQRLIAALPTPQTGHPVPAVAAAPTTPEADDNLAWSYWLAGAGVLAALGMWWARRRSAGPRVAAIPVLNETAPSGPNPHHPETDEREPVTQTPHERAAVPHSIRPHRAEPHLGHPTAAPSATSTFDPDATLINVASSTPPAPKTPQGADPDTAQTLELAEIMLSMGLADGAAEALTEHIRVHPRQALYHWLKLLDVYRATGKREEFQRTAHELRHSFNVQAADWGQHAVRHGIEDYPHISAGITNTWRKPGGAEYLKGLLEDNRGGTRAGFPEGVAEEILLLLALLKDG